VVTTKDKEITKLCAGKLRHDSRKRGTDLKMKRQIRPRKVTVELLTNVKDMGVILHGLCPVLINR
jgi:hypothetical protein